MVSTLRDVHMIDAVRTTDSIRTSRSHKHWSPGRGHRPGSRQPGHIHRPYSTATMASCGRFALLLLLLLHLMLAELDEVSARGRGRRRRSSDENGDNPTWVYILLAVVVLAVCGFVCWACLRDDSNDGEELYGEQKQQYLAAGAVPVAMPGVTCVRISMIDRPF
eukprot:SAG22_NODE_872_length_6726_cov_2.255923_9_plen_164_part_00